MRIIRELPVLALFAVLLAGCASTNVGKEVFLDETKGTGVMVASLTKTTKFKMFAKLRGVDTTYKEAVHVTSEFVTSDWGCPFFGIIPEDKPCGRLVIMELPQGEYEFYSWEGSLSGGLGTFIVKPRQQFSKRFRVTAGKAVYVGNIHFSGIGEDTSMKVVDMRERDLALLYRKSPKIKPENVLIDILK